ncbi:receptor-type tyrosine-protein phosphatase S-like isoform X2 [Lingula anatina]|uniref:Receptor-type tyrosine-protein phosphatase S-like isoform X2 n=1 Tax=Lingula anatina TaxID=7574 RepID=A0A2R2ML14_LINAN|nr:receptor-type tyrosine-protein phosphatase S-like isoform X2 [Lingula anatina]|eukprot:XP_023930890.1 receptor-type tyrosine-protein phosphatase S-like isoform X2 [Lingula anatina]
MAPPTVVSRSKDSIELTWEAPWPPGGIITEYDIGYTMEVTNWKIRAKTNLGYGEYSETIETITVEGKPGPPSNFTATSRSQTSLEFSWKAPRVRNGIITGYKIECYTDGKGVSAELSMHARSYMFKQLVSGTRYTCSLKAKTSAGYGNSSQLVTWTEPKDSEIGGIVGGVVGATFVAAVVVMAIVITLLRRRRREREANSSRSVPEREVSNLGLEHCSEDTDYEHPMRHWQETLYTDLVLRSNDDVEQPVTGGLGEDRSRF